MVEGLHSEAALWHELLQLGPRLLTYFLSFLTLGIFWVGLLNAHSTPEMRAASRRRIVVYQALYALGLLLGVITPYAGIAFLVLLQLNSAIAPRVGLLDRF